MVEIGCGGFGPKNGIEDASLESISAYESVLDLD